MPFVGSKIKLESPWQIVHDGGLVMRLIALPNGHFSIQQSVFGLYTVVYYCIANTISALKPFNTVIGLGRVNVNLILGFVF